MAVSPSSQGFVNEDRFFEILDKYRAMGEFPAWMDFYRRADAFEDSQGVDGFAEIVNVAGVCISIPFQIKSSPEGIIRLYQKHKVHWVDNLRSFIVSPEKPDETIWREFLQEMAAIRRHNEVFHRVERYLARNPSQT